MARELIFKAEIGFDQQASACTMCGPLWVPLLYTLEFEALHMHFLQGPHVDITF